MYSKKEFIEDITKAGLVIEEIESVKLSSQKHPDNFFALVKKWLIEYKPLIPWLSHFKIHPLGNFLIIVLNSDGWLKFVYNW